MTVTPFHGFLRKLKQHDNFLKRHFQHKHLLMIIANLLTVFIINTHSNAKNIDSTLK